MDNLPFKESDLASFGGLILIIPMLLGALKKLFKTWIEGKEPMFCVVLTYVVGLTAKFTIPMAFGGVGWLTLMVGLLLSAVASMTVHDKIVNQVLSSKGDPPKPAGQL